MANIILNTLGDQARVSTLLKKELPSYRQAYSDRTSWIMACLSELAYVKFNPPFISKSKQPLIGELVKIAEGKKMHILRKLIDKFDYDHESNKEQLIKELGILDLQLEETFDSNGTQAILISSRKFLALAFRGTESDSLKDIKSDMKAKTVECETGGKIHSGFKEAFDNVAIDIQNNINSDRFKDQPLFITGHSLGGALANIAAKKLHHKGGIAACYTFGSPRVGDEDWRADVKAPIYRIVNAADCVTMLPPGDDTITVISWILRLVAWLRIIFISSFAKSCNRALLSKFSGYIHVGDMRYLTNCKSGRYKEVELLGSVSLFRRLKGLWKKKMSTKKFFADHSISIYRKKLMIVAERRNQ